MSPWQSFPEAAAAPRADAEPPPPSASPALSSDAMTAAAPSVATASAGASLAGAAPHALEAPARVPPPAPSPAPQPELPLAQPSRGANPEAGAVRPAIAAGRAMRVVVFTSQKGGSGKTTLCGQLAVQAEIAGAGPVAIVDTDPQGSLADWWNARPSETPVFMKAGVEYLHEDLELLERSGIGLVFVDTPPAVTDLIHDVVGHADLIVVPTRPSPHDLRAVGATLDIIESHHKPMVFAVNDATARARITADTAIALSQHGTVAPVTVHHRVDFASSMIDGGTVVEADPGGRSAAEIRDLWGYIESRLDAAAPRVSRGIGTFGRTRSAGFGRRRPDGAGAPAP